MQSAGTLKATSQTSKSTEILSDITSASSRDQAPIHGVLGEWLIEDVDQRGVMDNVELTLNFDNEGRVSGKLGCNVVTGSFTNDMASLSFGPLLSSRKMCGSPALMNQEELVLRSLQMINALTWSDNGAAILSGPQGRRIIMRRIAPSSVLSVAHSDITPIPVMYRCADDMFGIAFEAKVAYLREANGTLTMLNKIEKGTGDDLPETFTNGRITIYQQVGTGGYVRFARGRMIPVECQPIAD